MVPTLTLSLPHIKTHKVRALAVTALKPVEDLPGVPAVAETLTGYEVLSWYGFAAPAGTPAAAIKRMNEAAAAVLAMADTKKSLATVGMNAEASTPEQFGAFIRAELAKWSKVAKAANIRLD
jgi:tripartite-type tricarboxylate transporter receptor subunit TctC